MSQEIKGRTLLQHARHEIKLAGLDQPDADYDGMLADAVLELIKVFSSQRHSGSSAMIVATLFARLVQFRPLTPLTDDPKEWIEVTEMVLPPEQIEKGSKLWQSRRSPACFSKDHGKTYKDAEEGQYYTSLNHKEVEKNAQPTPPSTEQGESKDPQGPGENAVSSKTEDVQRIQGQRIPESPEAPVTGQGSQPQAMEQRERAVRGAESADVHQSPKSPTQKGTPRKASGKKGRKAGGSR